MLPENEVRGAQNLLKYRAKSYSSYEKSGESKRRLDMRSGMAGERLFNRDLNDSLVFGKSGALLSNHAV